MDLSNKFNSTDKFDLQKLLWVEPLGWSDRELKEFLSQKLDFSDPRSHILERGVRNFSRDYKVSSYVCTLYALDLLFCEQFDEIDVEKHLLKTLDEGKFLNPINKKDFKAWKTILLIGRSGEGKSTLTNQIIGKDVASTGINWRSETTGMNLYVSDLHKLSIIDTEGLDGASTKSNQRLIENIFKQAKNYLETGASIDAIIIMWCPLKNGCSILAKILNILKEILGNSITESCIIMIQGNWRKFAEVLDLTDSFSRAKEELKNGFPEIPIIEYDAKGSVEKQLPLLRSKIQEVKPYQVKAFVQKQIEFFQMIQAFEIKVKQLSENRRKKFCKQFRSEMCEILKQRGVIMERKEKGFKQATNSIFTFARTLFTSD